MTVIQYLFIRKPTVIAGYVVRDFAGAFREELP